MKTLRSVSENQSGYPGPPDSFFISLSGKYLKNLNKLHWIPYVITVKIYNIPIHETERTLIQDARSGFYTDITPKREGEDRKWSDFFR